MILHTSCGITAIRGLVWHSDRVMNHSLNAVVVKIRLEFVAFIRKDSEDVIRMSDVLIH